MPNTYSLISSTTLSSAASSITLNLPTSGYTDLEIKVRARSAKPSAYVQGLLMWFNSDTNTANYAHEEFYTEAAGTGAEKATNLYIGSMPAQSTNSAYFGYCRVYLPNFLNTSYKKNAFTETGTTALGSSNYSTWFNTLYWNNTAALTSVSFSTADSATNNLTANTVVSVYGILKA